MRPTPVPRPASGAYSAAAAPARIVTASWNAGFGNQTIADSATTAMMTPLVRRIMCDGAGSDLRRRHLAPIGSGVAEMPPYRRSRF